MMLPKRPKAGIPPRTAATPLTPTPPPPGPAADASARHQPHTDYDLRPLPVKGLDHYVDREENDRFRVD